LDSWQSQTKIVKSKKLQVYDLLFLHYFFIFKNQKTYVNNQNPNLRKLKYILSIRHLVNA